MTAVADQPLTLWQDKVTTTVMTAGEGPPVVFLHGETGLQWNPLLEDLAAGHRVIAPHHPGTDGSHPDDIRSIDSIFELVLWYAELLDRLGVDRCALVGHSFGGMVAAEFAATYPERVSRLVLIAPLGLWREDAPVTNWMAVEPAKVAQATFYDQEGPLAQMVKGLMENLGSQPEVAANYVWTLACTGKFVWPIPDRGLRHRIHRITAPALVVWGRADGIIPASYAAEFASRLPSVRVEVIEEAAHVPHLEKPAEVAALVREFVAV